MHVLVKHKVQDYNTWKEVFDNFADFRKSSGEMSYQILNQSQDTNDLTLLFKWDNEKNAEKFMASDDLKAAMQKGGVIEEPQIQFLNELAQGTVAT